YPCRTTLASQDQGGGGAAGSLLAVRRLEGAGRPVSDRGGIPLAGPQPLPQRRSDEGPAGRLRHYTLADGEGPERFPAPPFRSAADEPAAAGRRHGGVDCRGELASMSGANHVREMAR